VRRLKFIEAKGSVSILGPLIIIILISSSVGCLDFTKKKDTDVEENVRSFDPEEGDLELLIEMEEGAFDNSSETMIVTMTLRNNASKVLSVEKLLRLGATLWPNITNVEGTEVHFLYMDHVDYNEKYSNFFPGETFETEIDLMHYSPIVRYENGTSEPMIEVDGQYNISFNWWGTKTGLDVKSNIVSIRVE
jgi:hypothetical protein